MKYPKPSQILSWLPKIRLPPPDLVDSARILGLRSPPPDPTFKLKYSHIQPSHFNFRTRTLVLHVYNAGPQPKHATKRRAKPKTEAKPPPMVIKPGQNLGPYVRAQEYYHEVGHSRYGPSENRAVAWSLAMLTHAMRQEDPTWEPKFGPDHVVLNLA